ncbi:histidine--tRNA ligase [Candidatus Odyssella acanthamoebae]|uniref:Histidine--tRNA ligase n=1 Tax=Candidatus Odyssella acanthamoebae TaxID=91604 RepID=A0A077AZ37_9PROT|nr:histidine--tRNA ligase [Candidatus Paracaedibacter acanthamoebae]AIK97279.1 histidyl-tRNA synthetase [Candidatus Paracaedibacter acanthamoebae]
MAEKLQPPRGTQDLVGDDYRRHAHIIETAQRIAENFGYESIATPIFESTSVFKRTIGETSDIVGKEMYTFEDRGGEELTLRPEGTAGVIRAVISNGLTQNMPLKLIYNGPMFRYERPQLGRRRQFHQLGVECLGVAHPYVDVETIALGVQILKALGLFDQTVLEINTIGDIASRQAYRQALVDYFTPYKDKLSLDSQDRLVRNPLRILDSKDAGDQAIIVEAPEFENYLNDISRDFFAQVCAGLDQLAIPYKSNRRLVRGLDYYNHTAFEFVTTDLGAQGTVLAGGRYDGLMSQMGGPETPGVGWALGIERLALLLDSLTDQPRPIAIIPVGETAFADCFALAMKLREAGCTADIAYSGNVGKRLKRANKINAQVAVMIGDDELANQQAIIKNLDSGDQKTVAISEVFEYLSN